MTEKKNIMENNSLLDEDLMVMTGGHTTPTAASKKPHGKHEESKQGKYARPEPAKNPTNVAAEAGNRLKHCAAECAKSAMLYGSLGLLCFYWEQTGQMLQSASIPSIVVCALLAGLGMGKSIGKYSK